MDLSPLLLFSIQPKQRTPTLVLPSIQRLHELRFLQKLGCQKPCWDHARLSSLVNQLNSSQHPCGPVPADEGPAPGADGPLLLLDHPASADDEGLPMIKDSHQELKAPYYC